MIADLKPYTEYKESGLPWLESVPTHWELRRLRHLIKGRLTYGANAAARFTKSSWPRYIRITDFRADGSLRTDTFRSLPPSVARDYMVEPGDILLARSGATVGKAFLVVELTGAACHAGYLIRARPNGSLVSPGFLFAFTQSSAFSAWKDSTFNTATIQNIGADKYANLVVPVPPPEEQVAIVRFLEWANGRLERAVRAKRNVVALLNERRQAIIQRAVTCGLNASVRTKPSGIPWLGDVPEHWGPPTKLKYISSLKGRLGWQGLKASEYTEVGPYVVSSAHFKNQRIIWDQCPHVTQRRYDMDSNIQLSEGDILLMKDGAAMGKLAFVDHLPDAACLNSHVLLFRPKVVGSRKTYDPAYMFYFMLSAPFQHYVQVNGTGATFLGISQWALANYKVCLPPVDEQHEIARWVDTETDGLNKAISIVETQISLLRGYRTRLGTDVVTGKLDVRKAAVRLPIEDSPEISEDNIDLSIDPETAGEEAVV